MKISFNKVKSLQNKQKSTLGIFSKALKALKSQNIEITNLVNSNMAKIKNLEDENVTIHEIAKQNDAVIKNINQFLGTK